MAMEGKILAQISAAAFVGIAITVAIIGLNRSDTTIETTARPALETPVDPLASELMRCQALGEAGPRDTACRAIWAQSRKRFLSSGSSATRSMNGETNEPGSHNETILLKNSDAPALETATPATMPQGSP
jgi:conjugative transfer region protein TrbK